MSDDSKQQQMDAAIEKANATSNGDTEMTSSSPAEDGDGGGVADSGGDTDSSSSSSSASASASSDTSASASAAASDAPPAASPAQRPDSSTAEDSADTTLAVTIGAPTATPASAVESTFSDANANTSSSNDNTDQPSNAQSQPAASASSAVAPATPQSLTPKQSLEMFELALSRLQSNSLIEVLEALETLLVYTKNLILFPDEKKYRKIKISNIHYQERLGHLPGAIEAMQSIGYMPLGDYLRLDEARMKMPENVTVLQGIEHEIISRLNQLKQQWAILPHRTASSHAFASVKAVGSHSAIGKRHNMEDDEIMIDAFGGVENQGYFGLYDGHGGRATVDFVVKALHMNLEQHLKRHPASDLPSAFKHSYIATDGQLRRQNILRSGTTSVTCVIRDVEGEQGKQRMLFTANVGDSRAVLCRGKEAIRLTIDHKASLPEEAKRIKDAGGFIGRNKRVNGVLAISRALGDHMLKNCGGGLNDVVSAEPYCSNTELCDEDRYILLACDGVWDVMTDQEAIDLVLSKTEQFEREIKEQKRKEREAAINGRNTNANAAAASANAEGEPNNNNANSTTTPAGSEDATKGQEEKTKSEEDAEMTNATSSNENGDASAASNSAPDAASSSSTSNSASTPSSSSSSPTPSTSTSASISLAEIELTRADMNEVLNLTSKALVREALDRRSLDNVTVLLIKL